jgi:hypothetical protein
MYQRPSHWLEVLISCSISVEIVSMIRQDSIVTRLRYYFSPLEWEYGSVTKHSPSAQAASLVPSTAQIKVN